MALLNRVISLNPEPNMALLNRVISLNPEPNMILLHGVISLNPEPNMALLNRVISLNPEPNMALLHGRLPGEHGEVLLGMGCGVSEVEPGGWLHDLLATQNDPRELQKVGRKAPSQPAA